MKGIPSSHFQNFLANLDNAVVSIDNAMDYIPFVSTINNLIVLVQKAFFSLSLAANKKTEVSHYFTYIKDKDTTLCSVLLIPGFGTVYKIYSAIKKSADTKFKEALINAQLSQTCEEKTKNLKFVLSLVDLFNHGNKDTPPDRSRYFIWLEKAAELEDPFSQYELSKIYQEGVSVPRDEQKAQKLLEAAAENNNFNACFSMATELTKDKPQEAIRFYEKILNSVSITGLLDIPLSECAKLYEKTGRFKEAIALYEKGSSLELPKAQLSLAQHCIAGKVPEKGSADAKTLLDKLILNHLASDQEIAAAKKLLQLPQLQ